MENINVYLQHLLRKYPERVRRKLATVVFSERNIIEKSFRRSYRLNQIQTFSLVINL